MRIFCPNLNIKIMKKQNTNVGFHSFKRSKTCYFLKRQFILSQNEQELRYCNLHGTKHTKHRTEENPKEQEASTL